MSTRPHRPHQRPPLPSRTRTRLAALAAVGLGVAGLASAAPAEAAISIDTSSYYVVVNANSGKAIDLWEWNTADGAEFRQYTRTDAVNQQFQFVGSGSGLYRLKNRHSGKVVDVWGWSTADGAEIRQGTDHNYANQQFKLTGSGNGSVRFVNANSGKALEVWQWATTDGARLSQYTDTAGANQTWSLVKVGSGSSTPAPTATSNPSTPTGSWPSSKGSVSVSGTIKVSGSLDGGLKRYCCIGTGGQSESQDAMFELANGATLSNVIIGAPAGDGVHCTGSCTLTNVWWEDVGEDAATFLGTSSSQTMTVNGGGARSASDKVFQHNGPGTFVIKNFYVENFGKLYRACGNCTNGYKRDVVVDNVLIKAPGKSVVGINTNFGDVAKLSRIVISGDSSKKIVVCDKYKGVAKGSEPTHIGSGPDGTNCLYSTSDVTYR